MSQCNKKKRYSRYINKFNVLQISTNISFYLKSAFAKTKNDCLRHLQSVDNQHLYFHQDLSPFTGKERDEETGYGYFGARYMDHELMTMWLSVDPMADKYPSLSPYAYCAWNPVKLVDPDGRDVYIHGDDKMKAEALKQLQQKSTNMTFTLDENGKLGFTGEAKTKREKYMASIIQSNKVHVNLTVQDNSDNKGETFDIGAFDGNTLSSDGKSVTAFQVINLKKSKEQDKLCENEGNMIWHEIAEAYEGGLISLSKGISAKPGIPKNGVNLIYDKAHRKAGTHFPGKINIGTVSDYINGLPPEIKKLIPDYYIKIHGNKHKEWYSKQ